jgi:hypothetical protein
MVCRAIRVAMVRDVVNRSAGDGSRECAEAGELKAQNGGDERCAEGGPRSTALEPTSQDATRFATK